MRLYNRKDFLNLPSGTIYAKGKKWYFGGLNIKGETLGNDWAYLEPCWISACNSGEADCRFEQMLEKGLSYPGEDAFGRDGYFDNDDIFLVFESPDLKELIKFLISAIGLSSQ
jgi:hypothetical protein